MNALRVLITTDAVGGVWQYSLTLAEELGEIDVETVLAVLGPSPSDSQHAEAAAIARCTMIDTQLPLDWLCDGPGPVHAAGVGVDRLARNHGVDLIHLNMPTLAAQPLSVPTVGVAHGCVATWWAAARSAPLAPEYRWHRTMMREGLGNVDRVVAPSAAYAATVAATYALPRLPDVVHNGRRAPIARDAAIDDSAMTVGRLWDPVKNAALLDRVAARLAVPFHAAGAARGPHGETVDPKHLHCLGELDRTALEERLAARPVFVSAATFEPFGLAVLEAAQAGCALVVSDIATFRELWEGAAVFVSGDDPAIWANAVEAVIEDTSRRAALGRAAHQRSERYAPEKTAAAMHAIYRDVLSRHSTRAAA